MLGSGFLVVGRGCCSRCVVLRWLCYIPITLWRVPAERLLGGDESGITLNPVPPQASHSESETKRPSMRAELHGDRIGKLPLL